MKFISAILIFGLLASGMHAGGLTPFESIATVSGLSAAAIGLNYLFPVSPMSGINTADLDLSGIVTDLGGYFRAFSKDIWSEVRRGLEYEGLTVKRPGVDRKSTRLNSSHSS